jgi:hypothetical protein
MTNNLKFGYSHLGYHTLVKLNVKFTAAQAGKLNEQHPSLVICSTGRREENKYRIEGCLTYPESIEFKNNLSVALIDYKIKCLLTDRDLVTDLKINI